VNYFLGIDIGTTHTKAVVITRDGRLSFEAKQGYDLLHPLPGHEEQDVDEILDAVVKVMGEAIRSTAEKGAIAAVGFSAAMHSILAVDKENRPLTKALIWADTRSQREAMEILSSSDGSAVYAETGIPIHPMSPLCKIVWFRKHLPELFARTARFISIKEYVFYRLFGKFIVDHSIASATGLFNLPTGTWSAKALAVAGIDESMLSVPVPTSHAEHALTSEYSRLLGLTGKVSFIVGASDGCLANFGSGMVAHGDTALTIGTSGAVRMTVHYPGTPPAAIVAEEPLFTYPLVGNIYVRGGAINNGGIVLKWLADLFFGEEDANYDELLSSASTVEPGAHGLLFLPYLLGERAPVWDAAARGGLIGLTMGHTRAHIVRAAVEGICFSLNHVVRRIESECGEISELYVSGGFVKSAFWVQLLADITGKKIRVTELADASAIGAAYLAMFASGFLANPSDVKKMTQISSTFAPQTENRRTYEEIFELYKGLYPKLKNEFAVLGNLPK
jgi:gluconokinase